MQRRPSISSVTRLAACLLAAHGCTRYVSAGGIVSPRDRVRVVSPSPFTVTLAGVDRVPVGSCSATEVIGRVLDVRGDTLVLGATPRVVPAAGSSCAVSEIAIFVSPPHAADVDVRRLDARQTVVALGATAFVLAAVYDFLERAFPPS